jgi:hypothetical protein
VMHFVSSWNLPFRSRLGRFFCIQIVCVFFSGLKLCLALVSSLLGLCYLGTYVSILLICGPSDLFHGATVLCFCWNCEVPFWLGFFPLASSSIILNPKIVLLGLLFRFNIFLYWAFMYCVCYFIIRQSGFHSCCLDL